MTDVNSEDDTDVFDAPADEARPTDGSWVALSPAGLLDVEGANGLLRQRPANLVAVIGERNGGKTTLITEIYDRFLRGAFADRLFCESRSLVGFEQKSFQARASSGGARPDTPRTSARDGVRFFHLATRPLTGGARSDLLISERAGETYRELRDTPSDVAALPELTRASTIVLILDGDRVFDNRRRAEAFASVRTITRAVLDTQKPRPDLHIQLVTTKYDLLHSEQAANAIAALTEFERTFAATYGSRVRSVTHFRTAARDPNGVVEPAWGLAPLLTSWLDVEPTVAAASIRLPPLSSEFDRLSLRRRA